MNISNSGIDRQVYNLIKNDLDATTIRSKVISNNMANINTAGYKRFDVVFKSEIDKNGDLEMKATRGKHINAKTNDKGIEVTEDKASSVRKDGNNVDLDVEKAGQASNTLLYNSLITFANNRLTSTKNVINGGGR